MKKPTAPAPAARPAARMLFSGMLARGITVEVVVTGSTIRPAHVERLRQHLGLMQHALRDEMGTEPEKIGA